MKTMPEKNSRKPSVSIITPSLNQGKFIEKTILSVLSQDYPDIEYIVIDGGSTDNSLEILGKYKDRIKWISEPDRGQADAVNKGISMARGEILGWLNSDDTYNPSAVSKAVEQFVMSPQLIMVYGDALFIDMDDRVDGDYPTEEFSLRRLLDTCFICQPAVFLKKEVIETVGMLDAGLKTCMDYEYWIRVGKVFSADRIAYIRGEYLANSRMYLENKTFAMRRTVYKEGMMIQKKYFGRVSRRWIWGYVKEMVIGKKLKNIVKYHSAVKLIYVLYCLRVFFI